MATIDDIESRSRAWCDAGIVDESQARRIVEFERSATTAAAEPAEPVARERMQALFGVLGSMLVGLGVLLTAITNWDSIGDPAKLAMLVVTMAIAYGAAMVADARNAPRWVGSVGYVVGMLVFSGGIFIAASTYAVQTHEPLGLLLVGCFGTGIALLADRMSVGWIAAVGVLGFGVHEVVLSLEGLGDDAMAAIAASIMLIAISAITLGWAVSGLARRSGVEGASGAMALMQRADAVAVPLRWLATGLLALVLVQASFAWHVDEPIVSAAGRVETWIAGMVATIAIVLLARWSAFERSSAFVAGFVATTLLVLVAACLPYPLLVTIVASALLALGGTGLVLAGLVESRSELFGWGVAWLVLLVVSRYGDFMASVDLGGPGFIGAGLLLLGLAYLIGRSRALWRRREEVLR